MMRALWSAASGMLAQQSNVDLIANNLSNVNTSGFKRVRAEFQDLFYANMRVPNSLGVTEEQMQVPLQVGAGVRMTATQRDFSVGIMEETGRPYDIMLEGTGFFAVQTPQGPLYSRDGNFSFAPTGEGEDMALFTADGFPLLQRDGDDLGQMLIIPGDIDEVRITTDGRVLGSRNGETENAEELGTIAVIVFDNPGGLTAVGRNLYDQSASSGIGTLQDQEVVGQLGQRVLQGYIESSNVKPVDEFVRMIVAQRAYEMNTKAIQSADEMLGQANNLRR